MHALGEQLREAARRCQREAVLVAPFVKVSVLETLLAELAAPVAVTVVARWVPVEILAGVCDLEIYDAVIRRLGASLRVHPLLHAKLYRFDEVAYLGSANLTAKALGWAAPSNIELLHAPAALAGELRIAERAILAQSIVVDANYRDAIRNQVDVLRAAPPQPADVVASELRTVDRAWLPACRSPEKLWRVYSRLDETRRTMTESAIEAAEADLRALNVIPGLDRDRFTLTVAAILGGMPVVRKIDEAAERGIATETAVSLLEREVAGAALPYSGEETWEVLQAWLTQFFPGRYLRTPATEVFRRGRVVGQTEGN